MNHPIEQEELMAYLDGELTLDRAAKAAAHLEKCRECQGLAGDLQSVSRKLMAWQVESSDDLRMSQAIGSALDERARTNAPAPPQKNRRGLLRGPRKPLWIGGLAFATLVVGLFVTGIVMNLGKRAPEGIATYSAQYAPMPDTEKSARDKEARQMSGPTRAHNYVLPPGQPTTEGPMIVRTGTLSLTTKEFDKARAGLEEILKRHHGYLGQLNAVAPAGKGRVLTATLRVPADQLDATMAELKALGRVENESQNGEEVTQQYVDLEARIANAQKTEQRLSDILRERTGKLSDVLTVENEIDRVRGEIERMEAERKNLAKQVAFATLSTTLTEEYENQLQPVPVSTFTKIRNAAVDGYTSVVEILIAFVLFLFSYGPVLLLWGAVLFFPVRAVWRRLRKKMTAAN
jgi:hypothetical protein